MTDLDAALRDLGAHLDPGDADVAAAVLARLDAPAPPRRWGGWLAAAAAVLVALAVVTVPPAREAVAGWLGIGAVEVRTRAEPPAPPATTAPRPVVDVEIARRSLPFPLRLLDPAAAGPPLGAVLDPEVEGLVEVRYRDVTLVEVASRPGGAPVVGKEVGPATEVAPVDVGGRPGLWLTGAPHQVSLVRPDGSVVVDSVRRAGDVLLWEDGGVTYRIEGAPSLAAALALAATLA